MAIKLQQYFDNITYTVTKSSTKIILHLSGIDAGFIPHYNSHIDTPLQMQWRIVGGSISKTVTIPLVMDVTTLTTECVFDELEPNTQYTISSQSIQSSPGWSSTDYTFGVGYRYYDPDAEAHLLLRIDVSTEYITSGEFINQSIESLYIGFNIQSTVDSHAAAWVIKNANTGDIIEQGTNSYWTQTGIHQYKSNIISTIKLMPETEYILRGIFDNDVEIEPYTFTTIAFPTTTLVISGITEDSAIANINFTASQHGDIKFDYVLYYNDQPIDGEISHNINWTTNKLIFDEQYKIIVRLLNAALSGSDTVIRVLNKTFTSEAPRVLFNFTNIEYHSANVVADIQKSATSTLKIKYAYEDVVTPFTNITSRYTTTSLTGLQYNHSYEINATLRQENGSYNKEVEIDAGTFTTKDITAELVVHSVTTQHAVLGVTGLLEGIFYTQYTITDENDEFIESSLVIPYEQTYNVNSVLDPDTTYKVKLNIYYNQSVIITKTITGLTFTTAELSPSYVGSSPHYQTISMYAGIAYPDYKDDVYLVRLTIDDKTVEGITINGAIELSVTSLLPLTRYDGIMEHLSIDGKKLYKTYEFSISTTGYLIDANIIPYIFNGYAVINIPIDDTYTQIEVKYGNDLVYQSDFIYSETAGEITIPFDGLKPDTYFTLTCYNHYHETTFTPIIINKSFRSTQLNNFNLETVQLTNKLVGIKLVSIPSDGDYKIALTLGGRTQTIYVRNDEPETSIITWDNLERDTTYTIDVDIYTLFMEDYVYIKSQSFTETTKGLDGDIQISITGYNVKHTLKINEEGTFHYSYAIYLGTSVEVDWKYNKTPEITYSDTILNLDTLYRYEFIIYDNHGTEVTRISKAFRTPSAEYSIDVIAKPGLATVRLWGLFEDTYELRVTASESKSITFTGTSVNLDVGIGADTYGDSGTISYIILHNGSIYDSGTVEYSISFINGTLLVTNTTSYTCDYSVDNLTIDIDKYVVPKLYRNGTLIETLPTIHVENGKSTTSKQTIYGLQRLTSYTLKCNVYIVEALTGKYLELSQDFTTTKFGRIEYKTTYNSIQAMITGIPANVVDAAMMSVLDGSQIPLYSVTKDIQPNSTNTLVYDTAETSTLFPNTIYTIRFSLLSKNIIIDQISLDAKTSNCPGRLGLYTLAGATSLDIFVLELPSEYEESIVINCGDQQATLTSPIGSTQSNSHNFTELGENVECPVNATIYINGQNCGTINKSFKTAGYGIAEIRDITPTTATCYIKNMLFETPQHLMYYLSINGTWIKQGDEYTLGGETTTNGYVFTNLQPLTEYAYKVEIYDNIDNTLETTLNGRFKTIANTGVLSFTMSKKSFKCKLLKYPYNEFYKIKYDLYNSSNQLLNSAMRDINKGIGDEVEFTGLWYSTEYKVVATVYRGTSKDVFTETRYTLSPKTPKLHAGVSSDDITAFEAYVDEAETDLEYSAIFVLSQGGTEKKRQVFNLVNGFMNGLFTYTLTEGVTYTLTVELYSSKLNPSSIYLTKKIKTPDRYTLEYNNVTATSVELSLSNCKNTDSAIVTYTLNGTTITRTVPAGLPDSDPVKFTGLTENTKYTATSTVTVSGHTYNSQIAFRTKADIITMSVDVISEDNTRDFYIYSTNCAALVNIDGLDPNELAYSIYITAEQDGRVIRDATIISEMSPTISQIVTGLPNGSYVNFNAVITNQRTGAITKISKRVFVSIEPFKLMEQDDRVPFITVYIKPDQVYRAELTMYKVGQTAPFFTQTQYTTPGIYDQSIGDYEGGTTRLQWIPTGQRIPDGSYYAYLNVYTQYGTEVLWKRNARLELDTGIAPCTFYVDYVDRTSADIEFMVEPHGTPGKITYILSDDLTDREIRTGSFNVEKMPSGYRWYEYITFSGLTPAHKYKLSMTLLYTKNDKQTSYTYFNSFFTDGDLPIPLWDWTKSNGEAPRWQTQYAYEAIIMGGSVGNFNHTVWNDLVNKIYAIEQYEGSEWKRGLFDGNVTYYYMQFHNNYKTLTGRHMNTLVGQIPYEFMDRHLKYSYITGEFIQGRPVLGWYFLKIAESINNWITHTEVR